MALQWLALWASFGLLLPLLRWQLESQYPDFITSIWWFSGGLLLLLLLIDGLSRRIIAQIFIERVLPGSFALGEKNTVVLKINQSSRRAMRFELEDDYPQAMRTEGLPHALLLKAGESTEIRYLVYPLERGNARFGNVVIRVRSAFGLWQFIARKAEQQTVKIYPNFAVISHLELLVHDQQLSQLGVRVQPRRGEGTDFHQLREFRQGEALKQVDWKASARQQKLISREYQDERDQDVIFLLDSGRRMRSKDSELSHFDHSLNALLLTAYVALRQGDAAGLLSFAGEERWLAPVKGRARINLLMNQVYDLQSSAQTSDFIEVAKHLLNRHRKRSLVIILTNARSEDGYDLLAAVRLLQKRHLVMVASLREEVLDHTVDTTVINFESALSYSGTVQYLLQRRQLIDRLRAQGVIMVDALPQELHIQLVNEYLALKRSGRL